MPTSSTFVSSVLERLNHLAPVSARPMFGGHGLYVEGVMFALIADERIYLKVDGENQPFFVEAGSRPFIYDCKEKSMVMSYYLLPIDIYENLDELKVWLDSAVGAARRNQAKKKPKSKLPR
ncbi:TfoX/Sxy family protein [Acaryochloris sp. CCMEE 5410]|uniref:TfoX/Sxy family protein n=1 Tax=Acaryochloris sp. CCMEE 5410 TaxID=310037 RepID=UPI0002484133|nr:TfoX/Sxy family protein [Acaryochloris sp. CCMEE 5410]KAI9133449.1 TfoX/Sxy family protein [Acaryochloris sp. CCMEE 5410]